MEIRLKELRTDKGLTQQQVAAAIGVNYKTIGQYERGDREPDIKTIKKLCAFFDVTTDYFLCVSEI